MASVDLGIDLGTATVVVMTAPRALCSKSLRWWPSTPKPTRYSVGEEAYRMLGRTPDKIRAVRPLQDGVISDFNSTEKMIQSFLRRWGTRSSGPGWPSASLRHHRSGIPGCGGCRCGRRRPEGLFD